MLREAHPDVRLAPDMALALDLPPSTPDRDEGLFLRDDVERTAGAAATRRRSRPPRTNMWPSPAATAAS